jgi:hypothetical protein
LDPPFLGFDLGDHSGSGIAEAVQRPAN